MVDYWAGLRYTIGMVIMHGNRFRIEPDEAQKTLMYGYAGMNRYTWNKSLSLQIDRLENNEKLLSYKDLCGLLPGWKIEHPFLKEAPSQTLQQTMKHLDVAIWAALDKTDPKRFPVFKKKGKSKNSFVFPQGFRIDERNSRIFLPKIGWVRYRKSRPLRGTAKSITVSEKNGKWYVSILTEETVPEPVHPKRDEEPVGMDLGIKKLAAFSDGEIIPPIDSLRKHEKKLNRLQRELCRRKKGSKNREKTKRKIADLHERISNIRNDYLHNASARVSKSHAVIFAEALMIKNMSKSASGTIENPGNNVSSKAGLNKSILDQGWGELRRQIGYKLSWRGGLFLEVSSMNTSRACPKCGYTDAENRKTQASFFCVACGYAADADINAAVNIRDKGLLLHAETLYNWRQGYAVSSNACGGRCVGGPVKQEPAEVA
jgi:putative transposase